jgi:hypothetical protein
LLRFEFDSSLLVVVVFAQLGLALALTCFIFGKIIRLYRGRYRIASFDELLALLVVTASATAPIALAVVLWGNQWERV